MKVYTVDAFTSEPFSGNPAAVALVEKGKVRLTLASVVLSSYVAIKCSHTHTHIITHYFLLGAGRCHNEKACGRDESFRDGIRC